MVAHKPYLQLFNLLAGQQNEHALSEVQSMSIKKDGILSKLLEQVEYRELELTNDFIS